MIDCNITKNYIYERKRMCESYSCFECPLSSKTNGTKKICRVFENCYPDKVIEIVQKWSDEHPQRTLLTEFLEHYPNTPLEYHGTPDSICPCDLGLKSIDDCNKDCNCIECWYTPIESEK